MPNNPAEKKGLSRRELLKLSLATMFSFACAATGLLPTPEEIPEAGKFPDIPGITPLSPELDLQQIIDFISESIQKLPDPDYSITDDETKNPIMAENWSEVISLEPGQDQQFQDLINKMQNSNFAPFRDVISYLYGNNVETQFTSFEDKTIIDLLFASPEDKALTARKLSQDGRLNFKLYINSDFYVKSERSGDLGYSYLKFALSVIHEVAHMQFGDQIFNEYYQKNESLYTPQQLYDAYLGFFDYDQNYADWITAAAFDSFNQMDPQKFPILPDELGNDLTIRRRIRENPPEDPSLPLWLTSEWAQR